MDEWLFWEQYSHEPYIAVCRFQMVYLGKPASGLDTDKIKRGYAALARMEHQLAATRYLVGDSVSLADIRCWPIPAWRMRAAFTRRLRRRAALDRRGRARAGLAGRMKTPATADQQRYPDLQFSAARRDDVASIVAMLAEDALGRGRERIEDPLPAVLHQAFETVARDPNIQLVVAEGE